MKSKNQIVNQLNGTNTFTDLEPQGPVRAETAEMPILLALKSIIKAQALEPGVDCEIVDYHLTSQGIVVEYRKGTFKKVHNVPDHIGEFFGGTTPTTVDDFE